MQKTKTVTCFTQLYFQASRKIFYYFILKWVCYFMTLPPQSNKIVLSLLADCIKV